MVEAGPCAGPLLRLSQVRRREAGGPSLTARTTGQMATSTIDESALTKGQLRKLRALRKSVGADIGDRAFADWRAAQAAPASDDARAARIAGALWPLVENGSLKIPRGGYIVRRGRGRIVVEPAGT